MKYLIHILGPGASGKSTLSRGLLDHGIQVAPDGSTGITETMTTVPCTVKGIAGTEKVKYCISEQNNISLAGNWKNGSDSIKSIDALPEVLNLCWAKTETVIVDPVRSSKKFVDWLEAYPDPLTVLFVFMDISLEENMNRLLRRRRENAQKKGDFTPETVLPEKTYENMLAFRDRASTVWKYACSGYKRFPRLHLVVPERLTPKEAVTAVLSALDYLKQGGGVVKIAN